MQENNSEQKYNEIVVLVHPFWNIIYPIVENSVIDFEKKGWDNWIQDKNIKTTKFKTKEETFDFIKKSAILRQSFQRSIMAYREELLKCKDKPNTIFILVKPGKTYSWIAEKDQKYLKKKII